MRFKTLTFIASTLKYKCKFIGAWFNGRTTVSKTVDVGSIPTAPATIQEPNFMNTILVIGTGQIGKATLLRLLKNQPKKVVVHNLTQKESEDSINLFSPLFKKTKFIESHGNIFMPYKLKDLTRQDLINHSKEIIEYFYSELSEELLKRSTIYNLISKYRPDIIIDAVNSATFLGNAYNPEKEKNLFDKNSTKCCENLMVDDFVTKIINFVSGLKYALECYPVKRYIKVSTTGLGGMGLNIPYTHGDNPQFNLSYALMGKVSASGVMHQLLWSLAHTPGFNISLVVPGTFVGLDSVKDEPVDNSYGFVRKRKTSFVYLLKLGEELKYARKEDDALLHFPVVRAGENHVYSEKELKLLTAIGQMEAITKEEVAKAVTDIVAGDNRNDLFVAMDKATLQPTYAGHKMVDEAIKKLQKFGYEYGVATGNLGGRTAKHLYELHCIKQVAPTVKDVLDNNLVKKVNDYVLKNNELTCEMISLGIPVIFQNKDIAIGEYTLLPEAGAEKKITKEHLERWRSQCWVDLSKNNLAKWQKLFREIKNLVDKKEKLCNNFVNNEIVSLNGDYDIAEVLVYYYNSRGKGRKQTD